MERRIHATGRQLLAIEKGGRRTEVEVMYVTEMQGGHKIATVLDVGLRRDEFLLMTFGEAIEVLNEAQRIFELLHGGMTP